MSEYEIRKPIQKRSIEKKGKIIESGFELICEKGYYNTNTAEIAKNAGVSTGIVYQYFKDAIRIRNQFPSIVKGRTSYIDSVSNDTLCAIEKSYEKEKVCIFYNLSEQSSTVQLGDVTLSGNDVLTEEMLEATLVTTKEGVTITDGVMTMPAYSVAVYLVSE